MKQNAARLVPFTLYNIQPFINREHPKFFPDSLQYKEYWTEQARRCVEGYWGYDYADGNGGWRYMPGNLYFYMNFVPILQEGEQGSQVTGFPRLRDIDWLQFYAYLECDGFSGFSEDLEYTCYRPVGKLEAGEVLSKKEKILMERYDKHLRKPNGRLKKYIDTKDYIYKTYEEPLKGQAQFLNEAKNVLIFGTRGSGKSLGTAGGIITYDFTFNGARTLSEFIDKSTSTTVVVGAPKSGKSNELMDKFIMAYDYLRTDVGAYRDGGFDEAGCFWNPYEGSPVLGKAVTKRVKQKGGKGYTGQETKIVHVSYQQSASAGVGYRARRMVVEEIGLAHNFKAIHSENSATQKRETKFGYSVYLGTGGDVEKVQEVRDAFYNPDSYDCISFPDVFNNTGKRIGLFIPAYYRSALYKDENGNTDIEAAFQDEILEREQSKKEGSKAFQGRIISYPIVPQEMFMQSSGNAFCTDLIEERVSELETTGEYKEHSVGTLVYTNMTNSECKWEEDTKRALTPILRYGQESGMRDKSGALVIYEHPIENLPEPTYTNPLYLVLYDPVAKDGEGTSLCAAFVFKTWDLGSGGLQFTIVAEWIGRNEKLEDNHEMAYKLATYYKAKILPEVNNTDILRYANMTNRYHYLQPRPGLALDGMVKQRKYEVGIKISPGMIPHLETVGNEYLITEVDSKTMIDGSEVIVDVKKAVQNIKSMRLLEELLYYNRDDNFDAVSAMFLLAVWLRQQKLKPIQYESTRQFEEESRQLKQMFKVNLPKKHPAYNY